MSRGRTVEDHVDGFSGLGDFVAATGGSARVTYRISATKEKRLYRMSVKNELIVH